MRGRWNPAADDEQGPWYVTLDFGSVNGRLECVGLHLTPADDAHPKILNTRVLRLLPLSRLAQVGRARLVNRAFVQAFAPRKVFDELGMEFSLDESLAALLWFADENALAQEPVLPIPVERSSRRGRKPRFGADHYSTVAGQYSDAWRNGLNPTAEVAALHHVSKSTAAKWIATARQLGYLPPTERGQSRGNPPETS